MPRFVAKPSIVEAHQYHGHTLNLDGGFNAVIVSMVPSGRALVRVPGGVLPLDVGDWLVRDPSGIVWPISAGTFERTYEPAATAPLSVEEAPVATPKRGPGRPRKEFPIHAPLGEGVETHV